MLPNLGNLATGIFLTDKIYAPNEIIEAARKVCGAGYMERWAVVSAL